MKLIRSGYKNIKYTSSSNNSNVRPSLLDERQIDFTMGYMNKHYQGVLTKFVQVFTSLGTEQVKKNAFSGTSYEFCGAKLVGVDYRGHINGNDNNDACNDFGFLSLEATIQIRSEKQPNIEIIQISLGE